MERLLALIKLNFKEGVRERLFLGVAFLFLFLLGMCVFLGKLSTGEFGRILRNASLVGVEACGLVIVIFSLVNSFYRESTNKMLDVLLAYATRPQIILGKFFGFSLVIGLFLLFSLAGLVVILLPYKGFSVSVLWGLYFALLKLLIAASFTLAFCSLFRSAFLALFSSLFLFFASESIHNAFQFAQLRYGALRSWIIGIIYRILPNMDKLNIKPLVTYGKSPEGSLIISSTFYALFYVAACLSVAVYVFLKREY